MLKNFEIMIALRYLRSRRKEGFISVISGFSLIGIAIGVATLIVVMSVMNGYHITLRDRILGINGHITITSPNDIIRNYDTFSESIEKIDGVIHALPIQLSQAMVIKDGVSNGVIVRGIRAGDILKKKLVYDSIHLSYLDNFYGNSIIIGSTLARTLKATIGDEIKIISPDFSTTIVGSIPRIKTFKVSDIFDVGMYEYNSSTIFMPLETAQLFFKNYDGVSNIEVLVTDPENTTLIKSHINSLANQNIGMVDWDQINESLFDALAVERTVMFLILTLIVIIASFNLISGLIMIVKEKSRNIAILRTYGITKTSVMKIFILSGSVIGVVGTSIGTVLGITIAKNIEPIRASLESLTGTTLFDPVIYFLTKLPSELDYSDVALIICISLLLSLGATIYPAWRASKLMPAEILRYE